MAVWRDRSLEQILSGPLDSEGLTEQAILGLVTQGARESESLDFKLRPHLPETGPASANSAPGATAPAGTQRRPTWKPEQEWAKDVCQFANHRGGLLVIGVDEVDDVAVRCEPTVSDPAALEQRLRAALANYTAPNPRIEIVPVPAAAGGSYIVVVVPPSELRPHAVTDGPGANRRTLNFPVRDGADTRWMDEAEVSDRYRRRMLARADQAAAMTELVEDGAEQLRLATGLWVYAAAVPESLAGSRMDRDSAQSISDWQNSYGFSSPLRRGMYFTWAGFAAPGRMTFTGQSAREGEEEADPRKGYVALYADGRVFVSKPVTFDTTTDETEGRIDLEKLVDDATILVDKALSWAGYQAGAWGTCEIQAGILEGGELELPYETPLKLFSAVGGDSSRFAGTRLVRQPIKAVAAADLSTCETTQGRMAAAHDVASAVLQHFGLPEVDMIDPDGTMIGWQWGGEHRQSVEAWASEYGVAYRHHPRPRPGAEGAS